MTYHQCCDNLLVKILYHNKKQWEDASSCNSLIEKLTHMKFGRVIECKEKCIHKTQPFTFTLHGATI